MAEPGALEPAGVEVEDGQQRRAGDRESDERGIDRAGADLQDPQSVTGAFRGAIASTSSASVRAAANADGDLEFIALDGNVGRRPSSQSSLAASACSASPARAASRSSGARSGCWAASAEKTASARGRSRGVTRRPRSERCIRPLCSRSAKIASAQARQRSGSRPSAMRAPRSITPSFASSRPNWNAAAVAHPSSRSAAP